jgi:hypothetical protein
MVRWLIAWLVVAVGVQVAAAETLDIASFSPPQKWQRRAAAGSIAYSTVDEAHQTFAMFVLFASVASTGDSASDFAAAWSELVAGPSKVTAPSQDPTHGQTKQGVPMIAGIAQTMEQNVPAVTLVAVIVTHGRALRFIAKTNDENQLATLAGFVKGIEIIESAAPSKPAQSASSGKAGWRCWMEGVYEVQRDKDTFWTPNTVSSFGYGETQDKARLRAYTNCSLHMTGMINASSLGSRARRKTECHETRCISL